MPVADIAPFVMKNFQQEIAKKHGASQGNEVETEDAQSEAI